MDRDLELAREWLAFQFRHTMLNFDEQDRIQRVASLAALLARVRREAVAAPLNVWAVRYSNYEPAEIGSLWATEELANAERDRLNDEPGSSRMWDVTGFMVHRSLLAAPAGGEGETR